MGPGPASGHEKPYTGRDADIFVGGRNDRRIRVPSYARSYGSFASSG
jgi:hypothetical protein